jgi:hypothetical protein
VTVRSEVIYSYQCEITGFSFPWQSLMIQREDTRVWKAGWPPG